MAIKERYSTERWIELNTDWFQQNSPNHARFCIEKKGVSSDLSWLFRVRVDKKPLVHSMKMSSRDYYEGLWEYDVAEWFIVNSVTGKYIELNLAPTGAWWMMIFDAPRQRVEYVIPHLDWVMTRGACTSTTWSAQLLLPDTLLERLLGRGELKHNVCFILGQNPREYLSWAALEAEQPDFHRPVEFVSVLKR